MIRSEGDGDLLANLTATTRSAALRKATVYLNSYAPAFGAKPNQLVRAGTYVDRYGWTVSFTQKYHGIPVFGSMLKAQVDKSGALTAVNGYADPIRHLSTTPRFTGRQAARHALAVVRQQPPTDQNGKAASLKGITAGSAKLMVYRMGAIKGERGHSVLTYRVEVTNRANVRDILFVDARTGKPVNRYSMASDALDRHLVEANGSSDPSTFVQVWKEGDAFPGSLTTDQQNEVVGTGLAYWLFRDTFGRDSYDGNGHSMTTVNNDGRINCPNANWNGSTTNYCNGVTADDVVAHEWGHAYTEKTSGLIYQWQPGALNESYSDVWGETVDLIDGVQDEGEGDITAKRPDNQCSSHTPALPVVVINSPADIAKVCFAGAAQFGASVTPTGITSNIVQGVDPSDVAGASTTDGCSPLTNGAAVSGKIALIDRGSCAFTVKTKNAQNAGAIGVVIGNNVDSVAGMSGSDPTITIPAVLIKLSDRNRIVSRLATSPVSVTMKDNTTATKADSTRWLIGEKASAFDSASGVGIRDMWSPTCYGDPGKVSDAEYSCSTDDAGGVHSNSGVPNHAYALLVDGGSFNGVNVTGIGIDKAANLWFYNQTHFLTPSSGFPEFADGLAASCTALTGQPIKAVTLQANTPSGSATPITAADCQQVANVIAATQLRAAPTQCNFLPLFAQGPPATCGPGTKPSTLFQDDFENGLGKWSADEQIVYPGGIALPWKTVATVPGHTSAVAYGPAPDNTGVCSNGAGDFSSRDSIISPAIAVPRGAKGAKLTFDHSIGTELNVDGGNVKISVNGAPFTVVPQAAYTFNAPNATLLTLAAGNTDPMAGERAFTGGDGGKVNSAWGTSVVDLAAAGVTPGDVVRLRFDIGRDGCGGVLGWYVDNVVVSICKQATTVTAVHVPEPSVFGTASKVRVTVARDGNVGTAPTGQVVVKNAAGVVLGQRALADGVALVHLPATLPRGVNHLTARFVGTKTLAPAEAPVIATVKRGSTPPKTATTTHVRKHRPVRADRDFTVRASVKAADLSKVTGKVAITFHGKVIGKAKLAAGKVKIHITKNLKVGKHRLVAHYRGSSTAKRSSDTFRIRIVRR